MPRPLLALIKSLLLVVFLQAMVGCQSADSEPQGTQNNRTPDPEISEAEPELSTVVSESLHDVPLPASGFARVEAFGMQQEFAINDCSMDTELPSPHENWGIHAFDATINGELEDGGRMVLSVIRRVYLDESIWRASGHENEVVGLQIFSGIGRDETIESFVYRMKRMRPGAPPRAAWSNWDQVREADIEPPLIRVHPNGHSATFVGRLGKSPTDRPGDDHVPRFEDVIVAINCR